MCLTHTYTRPPLIAGRKPALVKPDYNQFTVGEDRIHQIFYYNNSLGFKKKTFSQPLRSTWQFPKKSWHAYFLSEKLEIAVNLIISWLHENDDDVNCVVPAPVSKTPPAGGGGFEI